MTTDRSLRPLSLVALISCLYDLSIGIVLLVGSDWLARTFGVAAPQPPIFVELNSMFLLAVGVGYLLPYAHPDRYRGYMWVMGPVLKGGGALTFIVDYYVHASPAAFLLFAASDGLVGLITVWALIVTRNPRPRPGVSSTGKAESRLP